MLDSKRVFLVVKCSCSPRILWHFRPNHIRATVSNCSQYLGSILRWQSGNRCGGGSKNDSWAEVGKYSNLASNFTFQPIAVENLGAFSLSTLEFLSDLGHKLSSFSGEERASSFLSISIQRLFYCTTLSWSTTFRTNSHSSFDFNFFAFNPWELYTQGH